MDHGLSMGHGHEWATFRQFPKEIIRKKEYDSKKEKYLIESKSKDNKVYEKNRNRIVERQKEIDNNQEDIIIFLN